MSLLQFKLIRIELITLSIFLNYYSPPLIASPIAKTLYFSCVIFVLFSIYKFLDVPQPIFANLCHTMQYVPKLM